MKYLIILLLTLHLGQLIQGDIIQNKFLKIRKYILVFKEKPTNNQLAEKIMFDFLKTFSAYLALLLYELIILVYILFKTQFKMYALIYIGVALMLYIIRYINNKKYSKLNFMCLKLYHLAASIFYIMIIF